MKPSHLFYAARFVSFFGTAFTEFAVPIYLFNKTGNPLHVGMQWTIVALTRIVVVLYGGKLLLPRISKQGLITCDALLLMSTMCLFVAEDSWLIIAAYFVSLINAAVVVIQNGYHDALIGDFVDAGEDRARINGLIENGRYVGATVGFVCAYMVSEQLGFRTAVLIDALSFLVSMGLIAGISSRTETISAQLAGNGFRLLFQSRPAQLLTMSQCLLNFAAFAFNASYVVTIKRDFGGANSSLVALQLSQMVAYSVGTYLAARRPVQDGRMHTVLRSLLAILFCSFAITSAPNAFITINIMISILIGYSQPSILAIFQGFAQPSERRTLGSARVAASAIAGSIGAAMASTVMIASSHQMVFAVAGGFAVLSAIGMRRFFSVMRAAA